MICGRRGGVANLAGFIAGIAAVTLAFFSRDATIEPAIGFTRIIDGIALRILGAMRVIVCVATAAREAHGADTIDAGTGEPLAAIARAVCVAAAEMPQRNAPLCAVSGAVMVILAHIALAVVVAGRRAVDQTIAGVFQVRSANAVAACGAIGFARFQILKGATITVAGNARQAGVGLGLAMLIQAVHVIGVILNRCTILIDAVVHGFVIHPDAVIQEPAVHAVTFGQIGNAFLDLFGEFFATLFKKPVVAVFAAFIVGAVVDVLMIATCGASLTAVIGRLV